MSALEQMDELTQLQNECQALENKAGISQPMERAREGRFIPLGALGDDASPDEYFADEHDHFRENARDAYFSVEDLSLRKKLIAAQRKVERNIRQSIEARVAKASRAVSAANAKTQNLPWVKAAAMAVGAVAIGYWVFGLIGAIAGAVGASS